MAVVTGFSVSTSAGRTARTWLGLLLGVTPLFMLVNDTRWFLISGGAAAAAVGPAWLLRIRDRHGRAHVWQLLPGLLALPFYLTAACVSTGAWAGVIPTFRTWTEVSLLHDELVNTIAGSTAPVASTPGIRLTLAALIGLGAALVDVLSTVLEAPAMVGAVLLPVYVISGATVRQPVSWTWFMLAAAGFLLMLSTTGPTSKPWGHLIGERPGHNRRASVSGRRIALVSVVIALLVPLALPAQAGTLLSDALRRSGTGSGSGDGTGGVSALASLRGSLSQSNPIPLFTVQLPPNVATEPFYLRQTTLDTYDGTTWRPAGGIITSPVASANLALQPPEPAALRTVGFTAVVEVNRLSGPPAVFANTTGVVGLARGASWNPRTGSVATATVNPGDRYTLQVEQPDPSPQLLASSTATAPRDLPAIYSQVPQVNAQVSALTRQITAGARTPYDDARALSQYFTNPGNGFSYSLNVPASDSRDALTSFLLTSKQGFCQQYAAAMAVMLRLLGVPSRVVVGYSHPAPDRQGRFTVTTQDAHAWVEAYLGGVGWTAFDPTPLTGSDTARQVTVPWAPQNAQAPSVTGPTSSPGSPTRSSAPGRLAPHPQPTGSAVPAAGATAPRAVSIWAWALAAALVLGGLAGTPAAARAAIRRRRLDSHGSAAAQARWDELRASCIDLGMSWQDSRSPRQITAWLVGLGVDSSIIAPLVAAVETARYGRARTVTAASWSSSVDAATSEVIRQLGQRAGRAARLRARLWPRSLLTSGARTGRRWWAGMRRLPSRCRNRLAMN